MNFTKTKLAVALASTLAVTSVQAFDLVDGPAPKFAAEATINATTGTVLGTGSLVIDVTTNIGFSIGEGTSKYVRYDFTNAEVGPVALTLADFTVTSAATTSVAIAQGGLPGDTSVIVEVSSTAGDVQQADEITFNASGLVATKSKSPATIDVDTYEDATQAIAQTNSLYNENGAWFSFASGYTASCAPHPQTQKIDVVNPTVFEDGSSFSNVSTFNAGAVAGVFNLDGTAVTDADYFDADAALTLTGDFSAIDAYNQGTGSYFTTAMDELSATHAALGLPTDQTPSGDVLEFDAFGTMAPGDYTGTLSQGTTTTYDLGGPLDLGTCATLVYSGSTDRLDFGLTPGGVFRQWVRITNPSATGGDVTVTVYNDAGNAVTFNLGDIAGVSSSTLAAHASSGLINIDDVYAAATAADASFAHNGGKLRVEVRGEFGDDAIDGDFNFFGPFSAGQTLAARTADGIYIQAVTLASDNTMFDQTK